MIALLAGYAVLFCLCRHTQAEHEKITDGAEEMDRARWLRNLRPGMSLARSALRKAFKRTPMGV